MTKTLQQIVPELRAEFPSLSRIDPQTNQPVIYLDGPAGSQVPQAVIDAVVDYYQHHNANSAGMFATSQETVEIMNQAHQAAAEWFGNSNPQECIFGANMTTLTLAFSRALSRTWKPGDKVVVTQLDHDGNVTPWSLAAKDVGAELVQVAVNPVDATLDEDDFDAKVTPGTRLVAFTAASNSVGSITRIKELTARAHRVGAEVYVDAVHWAPHRAIDVVDWNVDYCICSAYKFFGPHVGMLWGRYERLEQLDAYKLRPSPAHSPGKWMTGTQNFAAIAGVRAAIDYVASIHQRLDPQLAATTTRRQSLCATFEAIQQYESELARQLIQGLKEIPGIRVFGITDPNRFHERVPTVVFAVYGMSSREVASQLAGQGIFSWHGDYYAVDICRALGQAEHGMVRLGILHTTTSAEIDRTLERLRSLVPGY
jgi:cysteine desulfurase family protein (TIGR01976 family)